jgi:hypothetical protein
LGRRGSCWECGKGRKRGRYDDSFDGFGWGWCWGVCDDFVYDLALRIPIFTMIVVYDLTWHGIESEFWEQIVRGKSFSICYTVCVTFMCNYASRARSGLNPSSPTEPGKAHLRRARTRVYEMLKKRPEKKSKNKRSNWSLRYQTLAATVYPKREQSRKQRRSNQQRRLVAKAKP